MLGNNSFGTAKSPTYCAKEDQRDWSFETADKIDNGCYLQKSPLRVSDRDSTSFATAFHVRHFPVHDKGPFSLIRGPSQTLIKLSVVE